MGHVSLYDDPKYIFFECQSCFGEKIRVTIAGQQFDHIDNLHHQALITDILLQKLIFFRLVAKYLGLLIWMAMCINLRVLPKLSEILFLVCLL